MTVFSLLLTKSYIHWNQLSTITEGQPNVHKEAPFLGADIKQVIRGLQDFLLSLVGSMDVHRTSV